MYRNDNPDLPTLEPWILKTRPPADRFVFERNPYYYRVDGAGRQLPYIDRVVLTVANRKIIPAKTGAGRASCRRATWASTTTPSSRPASTRTATRCGCGAPPPAGGWPSIPNLTVRGCGVARAHARRALPRALSLAIDRREIDQVVYFGLAKEGRNTLLAASPLYRPEYRERQEQARSRGGEPAARQDRADRGARPRHAAAAQRAAAGDHGRGPRARHARRATWLELIADCWREVGIKLFTRPTQLTLFRNRVSPAKR